MTTRTSLEWVAMAQWMRHRHLARISLSRTNLQEPPCKEELLLSHTAACSSSPGSVFNCNLGQRQVPEQPPPCLWVNRHFIQTRDLTYHYPATRHADTWCCKIPGGQEKRNSNYLNISCCYFFVTQPPFLFYFIFYHCLRTIR